MAQDQMITPDEVVGLLRYAGCSDEDIAVFFSNRTKMRALVTQIKSAGKAHRRAKLTQERVRARAAARNKKQAAAKAAKEAQAAAKLAQSLKSKPAVRIEKATIRSEILISDAIHEPYGSILVRSKQYRLRTLKDVAELSEQQLRTIPGFNDAAFEATIMGVRGHGLLLAK